MLEFGSAFQIELETLDALPNFEDIIRDEVDKLLRKISACEFSAEGDTHRNQTS